MEQVQLLKPVLSSIVRYAEHFLVDEMQMSSRFDGEYRSVEKIFLKKHTTMVWIGGTLNVLFYMTYDDLLLDNLTHMFAYGEMGVDEFHTLRESAAGEIANIIIGHAIVDFPNKGKGVTLTPPVTIEDAKSIIKTPATQILTASLLTPYGNIELNVIGSTNDKGE
ncbi:MAG: chemotaxis protein CheX [Campylobacterales bacterium]|nr:chemotaxis protein CheX [Campylobacterales bacterium]